MKWFKKYISDGIVGRIPTFSTFISLKFDIDGVRSCLYKKPQNNL